MPYFSIIVLISSIFIIQMIYNYYIKYALTLLDIAIPGEYYDIYGIKIFRQSSHPGGIFEIRSIPMSFGTSHRIQQKL